MMRTRTGFSIVPALILCIWTAGECGILRNLFVFKPEGHFRYQLITSGQELTDAECGSLIIANMASIDFRLFDILSLEIGGGGTMLGIDPFMSQTDKREHDFDGEIEPAIIAGGTISTPAFFPVELRALADLDFMKFSSTDGRYDYDGLYSVLNTGLSFYPLKHMAAGIGACYRYVGGSMNSEDAGSYDFSNVNRWRPYVMAEFTGLDRRYSTRVNLDLAGTRWKSRQISVRLVISYRIIPDWLHRSF
jgi:hypothetical protein